MFKVEDKVYWRGFKATIVDKYGLITPAGTVHTIKLLLENAPKEITSDGYVYLFDTELGLEKIPKKVIRTMYQAISRSINSSLLHGTMLYSNEEEARKALKHDFVALGPAITFEVEE